MEIKSRWKILIKLSPSLVAVISILFAAYSLWLNNKSNFEIKKYEIYFQEKSRNYSELVSNITSFKIFLGYIRNPFSEKYLDSTVTNNLLFFSGNINTKIITLSPFLSKSIFDSLSEKVRILNTASLIDIMLLRIEKTSQTDVEKKYRKLKIIEKFDKEELDILKVLESDESNINKYFKELLEYVTKNVYSELFSNM